jgi:eukaryotic-like serine/threonine-protein kinase
MDEIRQVRVFVSSPRDVPDERERAGIAVGRLNTLFADLVRIETIRWETEFYSSHQHFQEKIPDASACDLVIAIFWSVLGTPMPASFRMENGERYPSGSAYEVLTAIEARRKAERPDVYVFRKTGAPANLEGNAKSQWDDLNAFFTRWFQTPDGQYLRAYHRFETLDEFERLVERLLKKWIEDNVPRDRSLIWPIEIKGSPFRSLEPFDAKHSAIFFGRERKVTRAVEQLQSVALPRSNIRSRPTNIPFLLIVGESGTGKSSLMRAGVAPRLIAPGVTPRIDSWRVAVARIGDDPNPYLTLAKALLVEDDKIGGFGSALPELGGPERAPELAELLSLGGTIGPRRRAPAAQLILRALREAQDRERARRKTGLRLRANLLLLVDQLENIFAADLDENARGAFARLLFALAATRRVWIMATLRSDILPRLITPGAFLALKDAGTVYDLAAPGESELTEIVQRSAAAAGLVYGLSPDGTEGLDERILRDAQGKNTLPLLQFALNSVFQERQTVDSRTQLTYAAYEAIGGLDGAIDRSAEQALSSLGQEQRDALPRLLRALAVPIRDAEARSAGGELTVHALPFDEAAPDAATKGLIDALVSARIMVLASAEGGKSGAFVSIAHQRVFESWRRARSIIENHRDFFRIRDDVGRQLEKWAGGGRKADFLLPPGVPVAEGRKILRDYGPELDPSMRDFINASWWRAQRRTVFLAGAAASFAVIAAGAFYYYLSAQKNFEVATQTADNVVSSFSKGLADVKSVGVKTIDNVLIAVNKSFDQLWATNPNDPLLRRSRADIMYQFATNYEKINSGEGLPEAENQARQSLAIREDIVHYSTFDNGKEALRRQPLELWSELAQSFELVGDVLRKEKRLDDAKAMFSRSQGLLKLLLATNPDSSEWALGLSRAYTALGDVNATQKKYPDARQDYTFLMQNDSTFFLRNSDQSVWRREISWAFMKIGDLTLAEAKASQAGPDGARIQGARDDYGKALCLRRMLEEHERNENTKISRDVAVAHERIAETDRLLSERPQQEAALIASLRIRRELVEDDLVNSDYAEDLATTYEKLGEFFSAVDPGAADASRYTELAAAFYQAAVNERRRNLGLIGTGDRIKTRDPSPEPVSPKKDDATKKNDMSDDKFEKAKSKAEHALAAARAGGIYADTSGRWSASLIHDEENRIAPPDILDSGACIAAVTEAARGAVQLSVAGAEP